MFFAACASFLVRNYAIYARHSGIPEIKTVLGGFVMKHFMGAWTLVIKSLGLVRLYPTTLKALSVIFSLSKVSFSRIWSMAGERRPASTCCMLLRQCDNEAL